MEVGSGCGIGRLNSRAREALGSCKLRYMILRSARADLATKSHRADNNITVTQIVKARSGLVAPGPLLCRGFLSVGVYYLYLATVAKTHLNLYN